MFHRSLSLFALSATVAAITNPGSAPAQANPADAAAYPCGQRSRLTVVPDQQGYAIARRHAEDAAPAMPARLTLGARVTLDRALFGGNAGSEDASHAPRR